MLDLDLAAQVKTVRDLILHAGRRRLTPATNSAAALNSDSPEFAEQGAPGVKSTRSWVWGDQLFMRDPPMA